MSAPDSARHSTDKTLSGRRYVDRKILRFCGLIGVAGALLALSMFGVSAYPTLVRWRGVNLQALSEIVCVGGACDTSAFSTDWQWDDPDYVIDTTNRFFIDVAAPTEASGRFVPLDYSDTRFVARFRDPASYHTSDGEVWRMYSRAVVSGQKKVLRSLWDMP